MSCMLLQAGVLHAVGLHKGIDLNEAYRKGAQVMLIGTYLLEMVHLLHHHGRLHVSIRPVFVMFC